MLFIGFSGNEKKCAWAVMDGDEFSLRLKSVSEGSKKDFFSFLESFSAKYFLIGFDFPLINTGKKRLIDEQVKMLFSQFNVTQRKIPVKERGFGKEILKFFDGYEVNHEPHIKPFERSCSFFEVLPEATIVALTKEKFDYSSIKKLPDIFLSYSFAKDSSLVVLRAVSSAYATFAYWKNPKKFDLLGNMREGYGIVPLLS